jgi:hypothetical protein
MPNKQEVNIHFAEHPLVNSSEKKLKTYRFLLSEHALSSWIFRTSGRVAASTGHSSGGGSDPSHIAALVSNARNKGDEPLPTKISRVEYIGGDSRSLNSFAIEPTVWFNSAIQTVVRISHITMSMCNHSSHRN